MENQTGSKVETITYIRKPKRKTRTLYYFDYNLLIILLIILAFGLIMLYSVSSYMGSLMWNDPAYYVKRQAAFSFFGLIMMMVCANLDYRKLKKYYRVLYWFAAILCFAVLIVGKSLNGSARWIKIGPISFQPSEIAKIAIIIYLAAAIADNYQYLANEKNIFKLFLRAVPILFFVAITNLSTAIIIAGIAYLMIFVASRKNKIFVWIMGLGLAAGVLLIAFGGYRSERIDIWRNPESHEKGLQTLQGLYAIGSGGLFGKGLGNSMQKAIVPEASNDMIFSIICEELGIIGAIGLIILYILLLWRCIFIAQHASDMFGSYIAIGVCSHIALQVILNIAVVTNTIPTTGITLPFVSYGGSALVITMIEMGIVLSVSHKIPVDSL